MRPTRFIPLLKNLLKTQTIDNLVKSTTITNRNVIFNFNDKRHFGSTGVNHASPTAEKLPMRMLLLGSPGAGKGTQSTRIQANFNIPAITSGDLLRQNIANGTEIGKIAAKHMERGAYVPDDVMIKLIIDELQKYERQDWLLDGFPRTIKQAKSLDDNLDLSGQPLNLVINLHVPEDVILRRIMDRWVHIPSGRVYNLSYNPPKILGLDDVTGEKLTKRVDDNTETFKIRLQKHHALTEPLLEYYDKKNLLVTFAGRTSDEIYPQVESELISRFKVNPRITSEAASNRQESSVSSNQIQNDVVNKENFLNAVA